MRREDVRRFCLSCSEKEGHLVRRVCVVRQRKNAMKRAAAREREKTERARERERAAPVLHAKAIARKVAALGTWKREGLRGLGVRSVAPSSEGRGFTIEGVYFLGAEDDVAVALALLSTSAGRAARLLRKSDVGASWGLYLAAGCEFFALAEQDVTHMCKVLARLDGKGEGTGWKDKLSEALGTLARHGRASPKGKEG